jgi:PPM family protein phosphatase
MMCRERTAPPAAERPPRADWFEGGTPFMDNEVYVDCAGKSDRGLKRKKNEDQFLIADLNRSIVVRQTTLSVEQQTIMIGGTEGKLIVIADGAGGHASGERASELAVHTITHFVLNTMAWFFKLDQEHENDLVDELQKGLERCHQILAQDAETHPEYRTMATTLTLAYILWPRLYILHVGDSRTYIQRQDQIYQITHDHSYADNLSDSRYAGVLWNALVADSSKQVRPEVHKTELQIGDTLLLCTDGLNKHVTDAEISRILSENPSPTKAARVLVDSANEGGGSDNTTVVVARFLPPRPTT